MRLVLRDGFISNGYPRKLVERTINDSWKSRLKNQIEESLCDENTQDDEKTEENPGYFDTLNVAYTGGFLKDYQEISDKINIGVILQWQDCI